MSCEKKMFDLPDNVTGALETVLDYITSLEKRIEELEK